MGEVISIREAHHMRHRRQMSALNARCRELIAESLDHWRMQCSRACGADRTVCLQRVHALGELLATVQRLP